MPSPYWIINARLECGYEWEQGAIRATRTELCDLLIENGKIGRIVPSREILEDGLPRVDARGLLILPSMAEKHIHLDKGRTARGALSPHGRTVAGCRARICHRRPDPARRGRQPAVASSRRRGQPDGGRGVLLGGGGREEGHAASGAVPGDSCVGGVVITHGRDVY